ncbi:Non-canonical non-ribosomal peptide synthetase FUB8 [Paramyrothecium foliicola]|nr:Non-canonical non-ribosomal peptide synthetase FUB8 [Paramyrothecium foliicola]
MTSTGEREYSSNITVVLTGSTGSLGSYLLDSLLNQTNVGKVFCLNRAEDGRAKQAQANAARGLRTNLDDDRLCFYQVDLSQPYFGLTRSKYGEILLETTHIIHNQWPVNFNWDLSSFEPSIKGVRHLLDFCLDSPKEVEFLFVSTIGTVSQVRTDEPVTERPNYDLSPYLGGYSASKLVCELIIEQHVRHSRHKKAAICRVGQIAGPVSNENGIWNKQEWLPTVCGILWLATFASIILVTDHICEKIIASSKYTGYLPSTLGSMDLVNWVPVDILSEAILELSNVVESSSKNRLFRLHQEPMMPDDMPGSADGPSVLGEDVRIYHAVNPRAISWADLVPTVSNLLDIDAEHIVPWVKWVDALRQSGQDANLDLNPGLKLLDFFESLGGHSGSSDEGIMPLLATNNTTAKSKTLASLKPVGSQWMAMWLKQWKL